jgi:hypothetical protein
MRQLSDQSIRQNDQPTVTEMSTVFTVQRDLVDSDLSLILNFGSDLDL